MRYGKATKECLSFAQVEGSIQEAPGKGMAMGAGEVVRGRQKPRQKIVGPSEDRHLAAAHGMHALSV